MREWCLARVIWVANCGFTSPAARHRIHQARLEPPPARHSGALLRTDAAKANAEENLDGKYLLRARRYINCGT
jgi:hypothetical protein